MKLSPCFCQKFYARKSYISWISKYTDECTAINSLYEINMKCRTHSGYLRLLLAAHFKRFSFINSAHIHSGSVVFALTTFFSQIFLVYRLHTDLILSKIIKNWNYTEMANIHTPHMDKESYHVCPYCKMQIRHKRWTYHLMKCKRICMMIYAVAVWSMSSPQIYKSLLTCVT